MSDETPRRVIDAVDARDGRTCAWHGADGSCRRETLTPQHRDGGMGGSPTRHRLSNVVWLCSLLNGAIESDARLQREAIRRGIKLEAGQDPASAPIAHAVHGHVLLDDEGGATRVVEVTAFGGEVVGYAMQADEAATTVDVVIRPEYRERLLGSSQVGAFSIAPGEE